MLPITRWTIRLSCRGSSAMAIEPTQLLTSGSLPRGTWSSRLSTAAATSPGEVLGAAARRKVRVFGLLWRSQPKVVQQSEEANAEFVRQIDEDGRQVLLD